MNIIAVVNIQALESIQPETRVGLCICSHSSRFRPNNSSCRSIFNQVRTLIAYEV
ncbi:hypothetical protein D3C72_748070 [compost metagenome]